MMEVDVPGRVAKLLVQLANPGTPPRAARAQMSVREMREYGFPASPSPPLGRIELSAMHL
jgi:hypothetical protein